MERELAELKGSLKSPPSRPGSPHVFESEDAKESTNEDSDHEEDLGKEASSNDGHHEEDSQEDDPYELPEKPYQKVDETDWRTFQRPPADKACVIELLNGEIGIGKHILAIEPARRSLKKQQKISQRRMD